MRPKSFASFSARSRANWAFSGFSSPFAPSVICRNKARCALFEKNDEIADLAEKATFEGVSHLVLVGHKPTDAELKAFSDEIKSMRAVEKAVILSTHILEEVDAICNRVIIIHKGRIVAQSDLAALAGGAGKLVRLEVARPDGLLATLKKHHGVVDVVVAGEFKAGAANSVVAANACPADQMILDVGPKSIELYNRELAECATLVWNGPLGAFEIKPFDAGTVALAQAAAKLTAEKKLLSVAGGGDTVAALEAAGVADKFTYISTAGGAFLEWMEGKTLPGVAALIRAA